MCFSTHLVKKDFMCFYCELNVVTLAAKYAVCNNLPLVYERALEEDQFCIKVGILFNVVDFLNMYAASCNL